jgi:DnaK suppressor protein
MVTRVVKKAHLGGRNPDMARSKEVVDRERYEVLKGMLEERRGEIKDKLRSIRETLPAEAIDVKDAEEHSMNDFVQEVDFALMQMKSETLQQIDEAIQRLENGVYGICPECGTELAEARLKALPFAILCRDCQELAENRELAERETTRPVVDRLRELPTNAAAR